MVTVVSKPPARSVVKEIVCQNCGSTLEYVPRDIEKQVTVDYGGGRDIDYFIRCPECSERVTVRNY